MRIAIAGGGPGGLYLSILLKRLDPAHEVVVYERNAPDDTFGFGVVFSDETLAGVRGRRPGVLRGDHAPLRALERDRRALPRPGDHQRRARVLRARPQAAARTSCSARAASLGVDLRFRTEVPELEADLVVAADGVNSTLRTRYADTSSRRWTAASATYAWFGTDHVFDAFTFLIAETAARRRAGPRLSVQRHDEHVHRRDDGRAAARQGRLRGAVRLPADREPHALDQLRHRPQRVLAPRERRAARRRRAHRALLDRLRHQAGDGGRDLAGVGGAGAATSTPTRPSAARSSRARSARRRARSSGSRASAATRTRTRGRSRSTCSRAAAGSPTASCACATRTSSPRCATRRRCSRRSACARWSSRTASWSRRWTCTPRSTARRATSTSCTSARGRSAAPGS